MSRTHKTLFFEVTEYNYIGTVRHFRGWVLGVFFTLVGLIIIVGAFALARTSCYDAADQLGVDAKWRVLSGCYYDVADDWIPADLYRFNTEVG